MQNLFQLLSSLGIKIKQVILLPKSPCKNSQYALSLHHPLFSVCVSLCFCVCSTYPTYTRAYTHIYILHVHIDVLNRFFFFVHHIVKTGPAWSTPLFK
ncbi:hypothetical protein AMTRI_Chr03g52290 [Amborella trichopoda]